jgi:hypothetical protein
MGLECSKELGPRCLGVISYSTRLVQDHVKHQRVWVDLSQSMPLCFTFLGM